MAIIVPYALTPSSTVRCLEALNGNLETGALHFSADPSSSGAVPVTRDRVAVFRGFALSLLVSGRRLLKDEGTEGSEEISLVSGWNVLAPATTLASKECEVAFPDRPAMWLPLGALEFRRWDGRRVSVRLSNPAGPASVGVGWGVREDLAVHSLLVDARGGMRTRYEMRYGAAAMAGLMRYVEDTDALDRLRHGRAYHVRIESDGYGRGPMPLAPKYRYPFFHYAEHRALEAIAGSSRGWSWT